MKIIFSKQIRMGLAVALSVFFTVPVFAASGDYYLKLDGVKGESKAAKSERVEQKPDPHSGTTYGPVITIKPKGIVEGSCKADSDIASKSGVQQKAIAERKQCTANH